jgi:hypothetical protein
MLNPRIKRWTGHTALTRETRNAYRVVVERPKGRRPLGVSKRRWEDNIKTNVREIELAGMDWINLTQVRDQFWCLFNTIMNIQFHKILVILELMSERLILKRPQFRTVRFLISECFQGGPSSVNLLFWPLIIVQITYKNT